MTEITVTNMMDKADSDVNVVDNGREADNEKGEYQVDYSVDL